MYYLSRSKVKKDIQKGFKRLHRIITSFTLYKKYGYLFDFPYVKKLI